MASVLKLTMGLFVALGLVLPSSAMANNQPLLSVEACTAVMKQQRQAKSEFEAAQFHEETSIQNFVDAVAVVDHRSEVLIGSFLSLAGGIFGAGTKAMAAYKAYIQKQSLFLAYATALGTAIPATAAVMNAASLVSPDLKSRLFWARGHYYFYEPEDRVEFAEEIKRSPSRELGWKAEFLEKNYRKSRRESEEALSEVPGRWTVALKDVFRGGEYQAKLMADFAKLAVYQSQVREARLMVMNELASRCPSQNP